MKERKLGSPPEGSEALRGRAQKPLESIPGGPQIAGCQAGDVTKPYKLIRFGAMDVTKPYKLIGFGAMDVTKPYKLIGFGAMDVRFPA